MGSSHDNQVEQGVEVLESIENLSLEELYELAREAKVSGMRAQAADYYKRIREMDPESWEAVFYADYLFARGYRRDDITKAPKLVAPAAMKALDLIEEQMPEPKDRLAAIKEIAVAVARFGNQMRAVSMQKFLAIRLAVRYQFLPEHVERLTDTRNMLYSVGDRVEVLLEGVEEAGEYIASLWIEGVKANTDMIYYVDDKDDNRRIIRERTGRIRRYDESYTPPKEDKPGDGCYVATCAYGSYDCPEVWTLRRFRDFALAKTVPGRAFIRAYYALSPKLVDRFGKYDWFKAACLKPLNAFVAWLNGRGFDSSPYEDRNW